MARFPHGRGNLRLYAGAHVLSSLRLGLVPGWGGETGSAALLRGEPQGLGLDFTVAGGLGSVTVKDSTTAANNKSNAAVDSFLTQSGTSPKLVLWSDGLYRWTAHNLALQSQTFDSATWSKTNATVSADAVAAPDGTSTADKLQVNTTNGKHSLTQTINIVTGATFSASVVAKAGEYSRLMIEADSAVAANFNLSNGTVGTVYGAVATTITSLGGGFYRCGLVFADAVDHTFRLYVATSDTGVFATDTTFAGANTTDGLYLWGAQYNRGSAPQTYHATTAAAWLAVPIDYQSGFAVLTEPQATNLLLNSATLSTQNVTTAAVAYTLSFFGTGTVTLTGTSTAGPLVGTGASNRVSLTFTPTAGTLTLTVSGSVTSAQIETGSVATSYVDAFAATVTRSADNVNVATTAIPFSASVGTLLIGARSPAGGGADQTLWSFDDGTANERIRVYRKSADGHLHVVVTDGGVDQADIDAGALADSTDFTVGISWAANSIKASLNAGAVTTDATATLPTMTKLRIGANCTAGTEWSGRTKKAAYYPRVPTSDAELQSLQARVAA